MKLDINVTKCPLYLEKHIKNAIKTALRCENPYSYCTVTVTLVDDAAIRKYNNAFRGIDEPTDVLSFPIDCGDSANIADGEPMELGDIVISLERAKTQAAEVGNTLEREVAFLCVHSILHLLGYDHVTSAEDEERMTERQRVIMSLFDSVMSVRDEAK